MSAMLHLVAIFLNYDPKISEAENSLTRTRRLLAAVAPRSLRQPIAICLAVVSDHLARCEVRR